MKWMLLTGCLVTFQFAGALLAEDAKTMPAQQTIVFSTGMSAEKDSALAGAEAAKKALEGLKGQKAKVVLVFDNGQDKDKGKLLSAVSAVFDASMVYGCSSYGPLTQDGNQGVVGVLALAGKIDSASALAPLEANDYTACGKKIAEQLKATEIPAEKGKLLILFGKCHVPEDDKLTKGAQSVLGEKFPIAGGAAAEGETIYFKGKPAQNANLGLLLWGDFTPSFAFQKGDGKEATIATAGAAMKQALGEGKAKCQGVLVFDCGGRRGTLGADLPKELAAMKEVSGTLPLFGFYGSGEISAKDNATPSRGDGFHVGICALLAR